MASEERRKPITIEQLYEYVKQLVADGHGQLSVNIVYETVFGYATKLDFVKPTQRYPNGGLFVEE